MWTRATLKEEARASLKRNYANTVVAALIFAFANGMFGGSTASNRGANSVFSGSFNTSLTEFLSMILGLVIIVSIIGLVIKILILNPIQVGAQRFFIENHYSPSSLRPLLWGFKSNYFNIVKTMFLTDIYIFLWTLLLIIPGIIKSYSYRMVPYILAENPDMDPSSVISLSIDMMNGEKLNAFILDLSFIPWNLLSAITFNIVGIFYVYPYVFSTNAELYLALKSSAPYGNNGFFDNNDYNNGGYYE